MEVEKSLQIAERLLEAHVIEIARTGTCRLDARVDASDLISATRMLVNTEWGYLAAITGLQAGLGGSEPEVLYHFCAGEAVVTLRIRLQPGQPGLPSVCGIVPFAAYFERELGESLGIAFEKPPNPPLLFSSEESTGAVFPLRRASKP